MNPKTRSFSFWLGTLGVVISFLFVFAPGLFGGFAQGVPWMHISGVLGFLLSAVLLQKEGMIVGDVMKYLVWIALAFLAWPFLAGLSQAITLGRVVVLVGLAALLFLEMRGHVKLLHD